MHWLGTVQKWRAYRLYDWNYFGSDARVDITSVMQNYMYVGCVVLQMCFIVQDVN